MIADGPSMPITFNCSDNPFESFAGFIRKVPTNSLDHQWSILSRTVGKRQLILGDH